jgi:hypothetical protein
MRSQRLWALASTCTWGVYSKRQTTSHPLDATTRKLRNATPPQYFSHTIYHKNAAQQARRNPGDPRSHIRQPRTSNIYANAAQQARRSTNNFCNICNGHLHKFPAYLGLNIYCSAHRIAGYQKHSAPSITDHLNTPQTVKPESATTA